MKWIGILAALVLIAVVLIDAFEVVLLPRRVRHGFRLARLFYRTSWAIGSTSSRLIPSGPWRTGYLSIFGPLSLFILLMLWAVGLITGFALLDWSLGIALSLPKANFADYMYFSGTTIFTLGYGDMVPLGTVGRAVGAWPSSGLWLRLLWPLSSVTCRCSIRPFRGARSPSRCSTLAPGRHLRPANCFVAWRPAAVRLGPARF